MLLVRLVKLAREVSLALQVWWVFLAKMVTLALPVQLDLLAPQEREVNKESQEHLVSRVCLVLLVLQVNTERVVNRVFPVMSAPQAVLVQEAREVSLVNVVVLVPWAQLVLADLLALLVARVLRVMLAHQVLQVAKVLQVCRVCPVNEVLVVFLVSKVQEVNPVQRELMVPQAKME